MLRFFGSGLEGACCLLEISLGMVEFSSAGEMSSPVKGIFSSKNPKLALELASILGLRMLERLTTPALLVEDDSIRFLGNEKKYSLVLHVERVEGGE